MKRNKTIRDRIIIGCLMLAVVLALGASATIAWFVMKTDYDIDGLDMAGVEKPYVIQTRSQSGYYKNKFDQLNSDAAEWMISSTHNLNNYRTAPNENEEDPAIGPGDFGSLEFRVNPLNADSITVDCVFEIKAYLEEEGTDEHGDPTYSITQINNSTVVGFLDAHILLFAGYDEVNDKYTDLIEDDESLQKVLRNQTFNKDDSTYTTIYWYWPEHLSDLTSSSAIFASTERTKVLAYVARNKDKFFKDCKDSESKVLTDLTNLYSSQSNQTYNYYNVKYDNADLAIGNNISYVILSMKVK